MATSSQKSKASNISIHVMERTELEEPRRIFRVAFGTFIGVPEPQTFWADREYVFTRWQSDPQARSLRKWMVSWQDRILPQTGQFRIFWSFDNPSAVLGSGHSTRASGSDHGPFRKVTRETGLFTFAHLQSVPVYTRSSDSGRDSSQPFPRLPPPTGLGCRRTPENYLKGNVETDGVRSTN